MRRVVVAGVGMTPFGYFIERDVRSLAEEALREALTDASAVAADVGFVAFANAAGGLLTGQECIRGEVALRYTGLLGKPIVNVENACASGSSALHLAWLQIASGQCDVAVAIGAEKLSHADKRVPMAGMSAGTDLGELESMRVRLNGAPDRTIFMDIYAESARKYMESSGATSGDLAQVAVKSHRAAAMNPKAQFRKEVSEQDVLSSRPVVDPLTLLMCSPIGDGAAAVILMSEDLARGKGLELVFVRASVLMTGLGGEEGPSAAVRASHRAYEIAGIGPDELDVVELHDATASAELTLYEEIGLCGAGEAPTLLRSGATGLNGRVAVNSSGGLLSRGHPIGATGCAQIVELVDQLRHRSGPRQREGAGVALAENGGGYMGNDAAAAVVTILSR